MEGKRKTGIALCSVCIAIQVLLTGAHVGMGYAQGDSGYDTSFYYTIPIPVILAGMCVAMIVIQCAKTQLIVSIGALVLAVIQFIMPIILLIAGIFEETSSDSGRNTAL